MALTIKQIENTSLTKKDIKKDGSLKTQKKISDSGGLYLLVTKTGKSWRYDYTYNSKRKTLAIGSYPLILLLGKKNKDGGYTKGARELRDDAKILLLQGLDPSALKQDTQNRITTEKNAIIKKKKLSENTFEKIARQWHAVNKNGWDEHHAKTILNRLQTHVFPWLKMPISEISKQDILDTLSHVVDAGTFEVAGRIYGYIKNVLEYAEDLDLITAVKMPRKSNIIPSHENKPMPSLTEEKDIKAFVKSVYNYQGAYTVCVGLKLLLLLGTRTGELRKSLWPEFDLEKAIWTIPAAHRKLKRKQKIDAQNVHFIPLSNQALEILTELKNYTGNGNHVLPSVRGDARPISENTLNMAIKNMGFDGVMVGHGTRTMFSTCLNQHGFNPDAVEYQLQHKGHDNVRAAYNRARYIKERTEMMQSWADYLDGLRHE